MIQDEGLQIENSELIERLLVLIAAQCDFAEAFRVRNDRFQISRDHQARAVSIDTGDAIVKPARTERSRRCVVGDCPELVDFRSGDQDVAIDPDINLLAGFFACRISWVRCLVRIVDPLDRRSIPRWG